MDERPGLVWSSESDPELAHPLTNRLAVANSATFFGYKSHEDFRFDANALQFTSAVNTPYAENNTVHGFFRQPGDRNQW